jgi:hypothetical protein
VTSYRRRDHSGERRGVAPSGGALDCQIVSSELRTSELESKLLACVRRFDFGAKDVEQMIVTWPVDFLPS